MPQQAEVIASIDSTSVTLTVIDTNFDNDNIDRSRRPLISDHHHCLQPNSVRTFWLPLNTTGYYQSLRVPCFYALSITSVMSRLNGHSQLHLLCCLVWHELPHHDKYTNPISSDTITIRSKTNAEGALDGGLHGMPAWLWQACRQANKKGESNTARSVVAKVKRLFVFLGDYCSRDRGESWVNTAFVNSRLLRLG